MGSDRRADLPEAQSNWLVRRSALSLLSLSGFVVALVFLVPTISLSQTTGVAAPPTAGTPPDTLMRPTLKPGSRGSEVTELQATLKLLGYYGGTVDGVYGQSTVTAVAQFQQAAGLNADGVTGPATWNRLFPAAETVTATTAPIPADNSASSLPASSAASFPTPSGVNPAPSVTPAASPRPVVKPVVPGTTMPKPNKPTTETRPTAASTATPGTATTESIALPVLRQGLKGSAVMALQERLRSLGILKGTADGVFGAETLEAVKAAQRRFKLAPDGVVGPGTWSAILR